MDGGRKLLASADARDESLASVLQLAMLPGIGPRTLTALLSAFGDAPSVLQSDAQQLQQVSGVGAKLAHVITTAAHHVDVAEVIDWCDKHDVEIVAQGSPHYPAGLADLVDAPPVLFVRGRWRPEDQLCVAIVGTRHATSYGLKQAERFGYSLAKAGVTVVSGLARGIDAAAHNASIDAGGRTIAVLGSGLAHLYPPEHAGLADAIAADGAVISEFSPLAKPRSGMFPQRNRLIASLSLATLVVEAPDRSGALITARLAGEQNRDVLAVPGAVTSRASQGCNQLIRDGATLVRSVDDVLEALGPLSEPVVTDDGHQVHSPAELRLNELERKVLDAIEATATPIDQVIRKTELEASRVLATISVLEMRRLLRRQGGQYVSRI